MNTDLTVPGDSTPAPYDAPAVPAISRDFIRPRLPELGRIRLGVKKTTTNRQGKEVQYPTKLESFRFTSRDKALVDRCAEAYGGTVEPWASDEGPQFQVVSEATSIPVVVPRAELAFSQWFENWDGAVCRRRCDGHRDIVGDRSCVCDPDARECLPTTRLSVLLPAVKGMGVWRVESHGYNAAAEILGTIELAAAYGASLIPATLVLAQRSKRRPDSEHPGKVVTNRFVVPVLSIEDSLDDMLVRAKQLHAQQLGILPSANERATDNTMRGLRAAVFSRWPKSTEEPERTMRLEQLSDLLGRRVETISADHDFTEGEALRLASMVDSLPLELQAAPDSGPAAGPLAPEHPGPANISAGEAARPQRVRISGQSEAPAEHPSDEELGEVPPPGGAGPGGGASDMTATPPSGPALAPTRQRRTTKPGKPNIPEAQREAMATRRQATVDRGPTCWRQTVPQPAIGTLIGMFHNKVNDLEEFLHTFAEQDPTIPPLADWTPDTHWTDTQLAALMETARAETTLSR